MKTLQELDVKIIILNYLLNIIKRNTLIGVANAKLLFRRIYNDINFIIGLY